MIGDDFQADALIQNGRRSRPLSRSLGVVTDDSPFTVRIGDAEHVGLPKFGSYTPTVDDVVYVLRCGKELVVCDVID